MGRNNQSAAETAVVATIPHRRELCVRHSAKEKRAPVLWLSFCCLDAPVVAVSWQWLFARTFHTHLTIAQRVVLFLTAWTIYLTDRVVDSFSISADQPAAARQRFCLEHRGLMMAAIPTLALVNTIYALHTVDRGTLFFGAIVAGSISFYFAINYFAPVIWRKIPLKEVSIGFLFALGTLVVIRHSTIPLVAAGFLFGVLCALNCLSISVWERSLDLAQGRISFATSQPAWNRLPEIASWILALFGLSLALNAGLRSLALCFVLSAVALAILNRADRISRDARVALADLVLLTPLVVTAIFFVAARL